MGLRHQFPLGITAALALGVVCAGSANAQGAAPRPIPAAECQGFAVQVQNAIGMAAKASEDDFTDLSDRSEGRSCHISASASGLAFATPNDLIAKLAPLFSGWTDDPARGDTGPAGVEKGYVKGNRVAAADVSWEPGAGASCSDKQPLSACSIAPQQKLWTVTVDIVER